MTREGPLAVERRDGAPPTVIFLPGYASDMTGTKVLALDAWAAATGRGFVRFDYRGCGASAGAFADFTLADWRDDVLAVIDAMTGPVVLVGSSMGGWLMLLAALARPGRIAGLVGVAAAPDFTDWGFDEARRAVLTSKGVLREPSAYGGETVTTRAFWESGQALRVLGAPIDVRCPVRLLHGQDDAAVPWPTALTLAERLASADVDVTLVKDGDHRLSRDRDIALLCATLDLLFKGLAE
jgi:pimeloyl-ACP methyl ester carboxylesterase